MQEHRAATSGQLAAAWTVAILWPIGCAAVGFIIGHALWGPRDPEIGLPIASGGGFFLGLAIGIERAYRLSRLARD